MEKVLEHVFRRPTLKKRVVHRQEEERPALGSGWPTVKKRVKRRKVEGDFVIGRPKGERLFFNSLSLAKTGERYDIFHRETTIL